MSARSLVIYEYFLGVLAASALVAAFVSIHRQPPIKKGSITTRWRESGDVVERCTSCHDAPHTAAADVIAIHPIETYGCVACHGGTPSAGDLHAHDGLLVKAGDVDLSQAACGRCHATEKNLKHAGKDLAPELAQGRAKYESQCSACHDASASHDRALPMSWMSGASTPTTVMKQLLVEPAVTSALIGDDAAARESRKDVVAWLWSKDKEEARARGAANVPGSSVTEGQDLFDALGCRACHTSNVWLPLPLAANEDFDAYYLQNPQRVRTSDSMPSFRLTKREAASIAKYLATTAPRVEDDPQAIEAATPAWRDAKAKCSADNDLEISHADCGAKIVATLGCGSCHAEAGPPVNAPDLTDAFAKLSEPAVSPTPAHRGIRDGDLKVALAAKTSVRVAPKFDPAHAPYFETVRGEELFADRGCTKCHSRASRDDTKIGDVLAARATSPSLFGEGAKVQPEWLLGFFRDPEANGVRPVLHPEWVWGEIVPQDKLAVRMPSYALTNEETTAIVRAFAKEDGGDYPYSDPQTPSLASSDIVAALVHVNGEADNGGACMRCHYVGALPIDRAKTNLEMLAPDLGRVSSRLRPKYVSDLLARPDDFVKGMPALWKDPAGPALAWTIPSDAEPKKTAAEQIAMVTSFLFLLRDDTRLPRAGDEQRTPILGLARTISP